MQDIGTPLSFMRFFHLCFYFAYYASCYICIGIIFGVLDVTYGLFSVVGGWISDKSNRRSLVLTIGSLVYGGSMFVLGLSTNFWTSIGTGVR